MNSGRDSVESVCRGRGGGMEISNFLNIQHMYCINIHACNYTSYDY